MQESNQRVCRKCSCLVLYNEIDSGYGAPSRWWSKATGLWTAGISQCPDCGTPLSLESTIKVESWKEVRTCNNCGEEVKAHRYEASEYAAHFFTPYRKGFERIECCPNCSKALTLESTDFKKKLPPVY